MIHGVEGMTTGQLLEELRNGGKIVRYQYAVSLIFITLYRTSGLFFVPYGGSSIIGGLPFSLISLIAGWWGFPWGPIRTIQSLVVNTFGGTNLTYDILRSLEAEVRSNQKMDREVSDNNTTYTQQNMNDYDREIYNEVKREEALTRYNSRSYGE